MEYICIYSYNTVQDIYTKKRKKEIELLMLKLVDIISRI